MDQAKDIRRAMMVARSLKADGGSNDVGQNDFENLQSNLENPHPVLANAGELVTPYFKKRAAELSQIYNELQKQLSSLNEAAAPFKKFYDQELNEHMSKRPPSHNRKEWLAQMPISDYGKQYLAMKPDIDKTLRQIEQSNYDAKIIRDNNDKKRSLLPIINAHQQYQDLIENAHKNQNLTFQNMNVNDFNESPSIFIHKSPNFNRKQSSEYKLMMVNGEPVYARKSNHWGDFHTNVTDPKEAAEMLGISEANAEEMARNDPYGRITQKHHYWSLNGGNHSSKASQAGYVPLSELSKYQLVKKADGGFVSDQEKLIKRAMMVSRSLKSDGGSLPPEEYTANLSNFMEGAHPDMFNDDGSPKTFYHGTKHDFSEFKPPVGHGGLTYVSPLPAFVNEHMGVRYYDKNPESFAQGHGKQSRILPVHVNVKNPFDYENPQHMQKLVDYLDKNHPYFFEYNNLENLKQGHWRSLEQPEIFNALKPLGHDSMYVGENYYDSNRSLKTVKNLGIINPKAIKSALGNRGTFDPNEADITKAVGGIADNNKSIRKAIMIAKRIHKNNGGQIGGDEIGDNTGGLSFPKEETDFRLRTKLNREQAVQSGKKPDVGLPKNERSVVRAPEGLPDFVTGNINFEDWKNRHENILTPEEAFHSADWYKNIYGNFLKYHNGDADQSKKSMMAWLVAQQNTSPATAMQNVLLQKEQMARGVPEHLWKAGGMPNPTSAARSVLADQPITGGVGQKITDFVDSALGKKTRSYYGNDEKAGTPFVVDVHTARDMGLIDEELINHLSRLGYNQDDLNKLQVDMKTGPSSAQYENRAEFGRNLTKHLNEVNWLGKNNWTPSEVQAVGWMGMTKLTRNAEEDSESGLGRNLRRVSYELSPGEASPWQEKYGEAFETLPDDERYKITHDMTASALKHASDLAGVNVMNLVKGTGAWQKYQNPSAVSEALSTQEGADIMSNALGFLLNQTEVWHNRVKPVTSNPKGFAVDFIEHGSNNLSSRDALRDFWQKIMDADSTGLIQGYQPIQLPSGEKGIRALIDKGGKGTAEKLLETLKEGGNLDLMLNSLPYNVESQLYEAEITKARNDWKESRNGQTYIQRLSDILGSDPSSHLNNVRSQLEKELESHLDSAYERQGRSWRKTKTKRKPSEKAVGGPVLLQNYADGGLVDRALNLAFKHKQNFENRRP